MDRGRAQGITTLIAAAVVIIALLLVLYWSYAGHHHRLNVTSILVGVIIPVTLFLTFLNWQRRDR